MPSTWRLILSVFLPFAAGYYLAYLFRTINAAISPALASDFGLSATELGLLASVYFLVFGLVQIPIGAFLDRFGPRRVQGVLLVIAAGGATLFGNASSFPELLAGRMAILIQGDFRRVIVAASVGNVIEWYDFYIFGSLAAVLSVKFFEQSHPVAARPASSLLSCHSQTAQREASSGG
jgi:sugar phosphate permease